jgi:hypothetical protein
MIYVDLFVADRAQSYICIRKPLTDIRPCQDEIHAKGARRTTPAHPEK